MKSWVYLFSKFTNEALLFEGLGICLLCAGYAAFWVLHKRRLGVIRTEVPSNLVKTYLNALILEAEQLRAQLFGLLTSTNVDPAQRAALLSSGLAGMTKGLASLSDPDVQKKVTALESQMAEQARAMDAIVAEKSRLESELSSAKASGGGGASDTQVSDLQSKIQNLEGKLAEYSVIEDDLANLKRLQQENAQLKAALAAAQGGAAVAIPAAEPAESPITAEVAAEVAPIPEPEPEATTSKLTDQVAELLNAGSSAEDAFNNLAASTTEEVSEPQEAAPPETAAPPPPAKAEAPTPVKPAGPPAEASPLDEDLVAEFEKMLNS